MTEVLFYHLQGMTLEGVLPPLIEKSIERGWRVTVQAASEERADTLDGHLWTYRDDSFLPHGTWRDRDAADQPVVISIDESNFNGSHVRFLVDHSELPANAETYERVVLVFNGEDEEAVAAARAAWSHCKARGLDATYWQTDDRGRWQRRQ